jgi:uncharacterized RDD family membrane protein YckC
MGQTRHAGTRYLADEPLRVAPSLVGQPLASPARRFVAIAIDWLILMIPTMLVVFGAAGALFLLREPAAVAAMRSGIASPDAGVRHRAWGELARFFVKLEAAGVPSSVQCAVAEGDIDRAATLLDGYDVDVNLHIGEHTDAPPRPQHIGLEVLDVIPKGLRVIALYAVAALYFTLFTASRRGATPGKRLLGIRVVHLGGRRLHLMESLERFVGYLHIPGTLGLAFLDLSHDPNRRMGHDRVAHTAVVRVRREPTLRKPEQPAEPPAQTEGGKNTPADAGGEPST